MATTIEALQNRANTLKNTLGSSNTAYAPNTTPSKSDVSNDSQLASINKQIEDMRSKQIRNQWYGGSDIPTEDTGSNDGLFMKGLKALQKPLNAIVGTGQYALGKGTQSNLVDNVNNAMKTGLTAGDVLKQYGVSRGVQVPLGFALDVMFDPVNWLTAGTAALIPRVGTGIVKGAMVKAGEEAVESGLTGAIKGGITGLTSGIAKDASTVLNLMPFAKKIAELAPVVEKTGVKTNALSNIIKKGATRYTNFAEKIGEKAIKGADEFDRLTGTTYLDRINKTPYGFKAGLLGDTAEAAIEKIPSVKIFGKETPSGEQIVDFFKYSTKKAADIADLRDKVINLAKDKGAILTRSAEGANFQSIDDFLKPGATIKLKDQIGDTMDQIIREADGVLKPEFTGQAKVADTMENAKALLDSAGVDYNFKHLTEAYKVTERGKTGVDWYDNVIDRLKSTTVDDVLHGRLGTGDITELVKTEADDLVKTWNSYGRVRDMKPLEKLLNAQQSLISVFKSAKVPMNAASHVVANLGNLFMGSMMGLPMWKPQYLESIAKSSALVKGRLGAAGFKDMFFNDVNSLIDLADNNPTRFKQLTGLDPKEIASKLATEEKITHVLNEQSTRQQVLQVMKEGVERIEKGIVQGDKLSDFKNVADDAATMAAESPANKKMMTEGMKRFETPSENLRKSLKEAPIKRSEEFGSYTASEIGPNSTMDKLKDYLQKQADLHPYRVDIKLANTMVNSMPRWYEHIDQSFKIGTADYLTKIGLTEKELVTVSRTVPMNAEDILEPIVRNGQKYYKVTPLKASEIATEAFMNYAAMPDFVRVMRALPIVGSPFLSFPYAMAIKTAKTAINNPSYFNKVGFMINEMNAGRTPQEKMALEEKYNQYLKSPTVVKMFGMWNTDIKNLVPYYQMNAFNPSQRTYSGNTFGSQIMKLSDKFPVMQDPVGQVIKDYFIQPWLLSGSGDIAQGQFGQPLYPSYDENGKPIKASIGTKAFYGGRSLAETVVPGSLAYLGLANGVMDLSPEAVDWIPSYGGRNLANATQGRSSIGAMTKEDAVRKTLRSLLGRTGLPAYTLDATKTTLSK